MVKVLVGQRKGERFPGFWAEFEGEKVSSFEDTRGERNIVFTLYRCTAYQWEAYRVHIADESIPDAPVYELLPFSEDPGIQGIGPDYSEPYVKEQIADKWPLFLKDMDYFRTRTIDPRPSNWSRQL
jgi:hypothetical protein